MTSLRRLLPSEPGAAALVGLGRIINWVGSPSPVSLVTHCQHALLAAASLGVAALGMTRPALYRKARLFLIPLIRVGGLLLHMQFGSAKASTSAVLLSRAPTPGPLGWLRGWLRLVLGMRMMQAAVTTLLFPLPLPLAAATHLTVVALNFNTAAFCGTTFLRHPLTSLRIARVWGALDLCSQLASPVGGAVSVLNTAAAGVDKAAYQCASLLNFLHAAFAILPLAALAWADTSRRNVEQQDGSAAGLEARGTAAGGLAPAGKLQGAFRVVDGSIRAACLCSYSWSARVAYVAWMLTVLWLLARAVT